MSMRAPDSYSPVDASRFATFTATFRGVNAYRVALALNFIRPGVDFRGCNKRDMAEEFAKGLLKFVPGSRLRHALSLVNR